MTHSGECDSRSENMIAARGVAVPVRVASAASVTPSPQRQSDQPAGPVKHIHAHGVVLAGGRSSRMGADKALKPFGGSTLIQHAIDLMRRVGLPVAISGSRADLGDLAPVIADMTLSQGPLTGICSALRALPAEWIAALTVDMPLVPPSLLERMLYVAIDSDAAVVLPSLDGRLYPFPCVLPRSFLHELLSEQMAGRYGCLRAFTTAASNVGKSVTAVPLESVPGGCERHPQGVPVEAWLLNVNRPEDLSCAESLMESELLMASGDLIRTGATR